MTDTAHETDDASPIHSDPEALITDTPIIDPLSGYVIHVNSATKSEVYQLLMDSHQVSMSAPTSRKRLETAVAEMDGAVELWAAESKHIVTDVGEDIVKSLDASSDTDDTEDNT